MPWREMVREQTRLLPPTLNDLLAEGHPARFVAAMRVSNWIKEGK